jgi:hypothetical protein
MVMATVLVRGPDVHTDPGLYTWFNVERVHTESLVDPGAAGNRCCAPLCHRAHLSMAASSRQGPFYARCSTCGFAYFRPSTGCGTDFFSQLNLSFICGVFVLFGTLMSPDRKRSGSASVLC